MTCSSRSSDGYLLEGAVSNLLIKRGDELITPRTDLGILTGTTQVDLFRWAEGAGYRIGYEMLTPADLESADAAWLVSSGRHVAPIRAVDGVERPIDVRAHRGDERVLARPPGVAGTKRRAPGPSTKGPSVTDEATHDPPAVRSGRLLLASQAVPAKQEARRRTEDSRLRSTSDRSVSVHQAHAFGSHPAQSSAAVTVSGNPQVTLRITDCSSAGELPRPSRERSGRLRGNPSGGSGTILCEGRGEPRPTLRNSVSASATALRLRFLGHLRRVRASSVDTRLLSLRHGARGEVSLDS